MVDLPHCSADILINHRSLIFNSRVEVDFFELIHPGLFRASSTLDGVKLESSSSLPNLLVVLVANTSVDVSQILSSQTMVFFSGLISDVALLDLTKLRSRLLLQVVLSLLNRLTVVILDSGDILLIEA
jgi:hypothetical protein